MNINNIKQTINKAKHLVVFTGAGISVDSGIPMFSGKNGLWSQYDPKFIELDFFNNNPQSSWNEIRKIFYDHLQNIKPNLAHLAITKLQKDGIVKEIVTQNIDDLHQSSGSNNVIEFHGTTKNLVCIKCGRVVAATKATIASILPSCPKCGSVLKPDFVFYGEQINPVVYERALSAIKKADVILIIGTSGKVMPANALPFYAKRENLSIKIIEVNPEISEFTNKITDYYFPMTANDFFKKFF